MLRTNARRLGFFTAIIALTLAATTAFAQETQISGTVSSVDPATRTISFADGSVVRLQPGAIVMINGREAALESLTPGTSATVVSRVPSTGTVGTSPASSTYGVTGTVAQVDRQNGAITLQDGRVVRLSGQSYVWQATPIQAIQPGSQIFVGNVQPASVMPQQPVAVAPQQRVAVAPPPAVVGTVKGVDRNTAVIALQDGRYVKVLPTTRVQSGSQSLAVSDLRPGDSVAVWPAGNSSVSETATVPRGDNPPATAIKADYIEVTRIAS